MGEGVYVGLCPLLLRYNRLPLHFVIYMCVMMNTKRNHANVLNNNINEVISIKTGLIVVSMKPSFHEKIITYLSSRVWFTSHNFLKN